MKDTAKSRVDQKQWETARVIYRHESQDELWLTFQINYLAVAETFAKKKSPRVNLVVF